MLDNDNSDKKPNLNQERAVLGALFSIGSKDLYLPPHFLNSMMNGTKRALCVRKSFQKGRLRISIDDK